MIVYCAYDPEGNPWFYAKLKEARKTVEEEGYSDLQKLTLRSDIPRKELILRLLNEDGGYVAIREEL